MLLEFIVIFIVALILIKLLITFAHRLGLVDVPNGRSMHTRHHPRGAGIGIFLSVALVYGVCNYALFYDHILIHVAVLIVFFTGVYDDLFDPSHHVKIFMIILSAILVYFDGIYVNSLGSLFGFEINLAWWAAFPFSVFAIVGFTNALNLIDGLDGLAGSVSIVILIVLFSIGYSNNDIFMMLLSGSFVAALLAFLVYNWTPASIFMGDSGSLVLGFVIGLLVIKAATYINPVTVLFIIAVPLIDTVIVMVRRQRQGKSIFAADKTHLHHVLYNFFNKDAEKTVAFLAFTQVSYSITGLLIVDIANQSLSLVLFGINVIILYFIFSEMLYRQSLQEENSNS